jgi:hypothetical protein
MIGILLVGFILLSNISIAEKKEKEDIVDSDETFYEYALVILDCDSISGIPENQYVGGLTDIEIYTDGFTQGLILTIPSWGPEIIESYDNIHIIMENFFGVTQFYSCGSGKIGGLGKNVQLEKI